MKSKSTTVLLAFFLGGFGGQYFYLGKTGRGVLCVLFFWTFIPALIAIIDFFRFLLMSEDSFNRRYNQGYTPTAPFVVNVNSSYNSNSHILDELEKLHKLKENGVLTEEEFIARKQNMLQPA